MERKLFEGGLPKTRSEPKLGTQSCPDQSAKDAEVGIPQWQAYLQGLRRSSQQVQEVLR